MKNLLKIVSLILICINLQCSKSSDATQNTVPTSELLAQKKQRIQNYINSFPCSAAVGCSSIAFGVKPCGGPWEYLVYSNNVNTTQLQQMVAEYNALNLEYNTLNGIFSDCMYVSKPANVGCVNGACGVIN